MENETIKIFRKLRNDILDEIEIKMQNGQEWWRQVDKLAYIQYVLATYDKIQEESDDRNEYAYCNGTCESCTISYCTIQDKIK